ncbi:two-component sensor histidine kinase [Profundibacter amoris]|uniref:histidine kinase n=2 Tax=Profundibacter amoris TaxID=2171755 RepID=A0A347UG82_9RHOB|nr:two-component sensor histidine kinase [Profundibacter amoris]
MVNKKSKQFLSVIPMPLIVVGGQGRIQFANEPAADVFGANLAGKHFTTVLRQPALLQAIEDAIQEQKTCKSRYQNTIGDSVTLYDVTCSPVSGQGKTPSILISFEDVSPILEAGQMRSDFVANVSHELRSPLTSLLGFIETLRGPAKDDAQANVRFLELMERETKRMTRLVGDLLSLSRVESEERVRPNEKIDVLSILELSQQILQPVALENDVVIEINRPDSREQMIKGDSDQLQQVFTNLIENAMKYGGDGGKVVVDVTYSGHEPSLRGPAVHISVTDQGDGIAQIHIPRLTERFYRIDSHRSREMGGTGLGLAIVKHIVNRHRGRLKISSVKGQGSTFTVILPAA